ncbi:MAG: 50S ribosomal protein L3 [Chitinispirillaceae bacterium]
MQGLVGKKIGMTRIFNKESGQVIPVTVVQTGTNIVHQIKTVERDGYSAVQLGFDMVSESRVQKPLAGHFKKHNSVPTRVIKEFELDSIEEQLDPGQKVGVEVLEGVRYVDVVGTSKGRGFSGTIKRHNFQRGRETHGNTNHREHGSLGAGTYPARVFPGVRMAGQYGNERVTARGIEIVQVDKQNGLVYLKGAIPGSNRAIVYLKKNLIKK